MSLHYKRSRRYEDHPGIDDWLMTYADMITLILCFFAIFFSLSVPRKDAFEQAQAEVKAKFSTEEPVGKSSASITPVNVPLVRDNRFNSSEIGSRSDNAVKKYDEEPGSRITTIDMNSAEFFAAGSATLSDEGKKALDAVLETVKNDKFKDYNITIEGHTDDLPINTLQFPSNWELSTGRAAAVARYFLEHGVAAQRIRASGYADTFPKVPNRDAQGKPIPENQAQNRRVVIKLEKVEKDK